MKTSRSVLKNLFGNSKQYYLRKQISENSEVFLKTIDNLLSAIFLLVSVTQSTNINRQNDLQENPANNKFYLQISS